MEQGVFHLPFILLISLQETLLVVATDTLRSGSVREVQVLQQLSGRRNCLNRLLCYQVEMGWITGLGHLPQC